MTVNELRNWLDLYPGGAEVFVTWEGMDKPFTLYSAADGRVAIDADNEFYRLRWQRTPCHACGKQAHQTIDGRPCCYDHYPG